MSFGVVLRPVVERPVVRLAPADDGPARFGRQVEAQQRMVALGDLQRGLAVAVLLGEPGDLVVEHVREPLQEEQRQQVVLELRRVLLAADRARRIPEHLLHGLRGGGGDPAVRRRRVTPAAASAEAASSAASIPASAASAAMTSRAAFCGVVPPSQRLTVAKDTPSRSASCSWVRFSLARMARSVAATACMFVMFAIFVI